MITGTREELEQAVLVAVIRLIRETGSTCFCGTVEGTTPPVYLALGEAAQIIALLQHEAARADAPLH